MLKIVTSNKILGNFRNFRKFFLREFWIHNLYLKTFERGRVAELKLKMECGQGGTNCNKKRRKSTEVKLNVKCHFSQYT